MDILDWLENQAGAEHRIAADEIKELLVSKQEGYVLVPLVPTDEMWQAGFDVIDEQLHGSCQATDVVMRVKATYKAMIEAAIKTQKATT